MTGGLLPKGFDTIIPKENVSLYPNKKNPKYLYINKAIKKNKNIRTKGSDYKKNDLVIKKGTIFKSNHILTLKTLGIEYVKVKKIPKILFFSTGNEISNHKKIPYWKVRNSNSHYIKSLDKNFLFNFNYGGTLRDKDELVLKLIFFLKKSLPKILLIFDKSFTGPLCFIKPSSVSKERLSPLKL